MVKTCPKCGLKLYRKHNSTIYNPCPKCSLRAAVRSDTSKGRRGEAVTSKPRTKSEKSKAMNSADKWFSRYIRIKYSHQVATDGTVLCKCIVTGAIKSAKKIDNGHGFSRSFLATRYEEDNCRPQNRSSNRFSGEADHYKLLDNLKAEIGEERFNRIDQLRRTEIDGSTEFYKEIADKYRKLTNQLIKGLGAQKWW